MLKASELTGKTKEELAKTLQDVQLEIFKLKTDINNGKLKNLRAVKNKRIEIARILTVMGQKENIK